MTFFSLAHRSFDPSTTNIFQCVAEMLSVTSEGPKHCVVRASLNTPDIEGPRFLKLSTVHDPDSPQRPKYVLPP